MTYHIKTTMIYSYYEYGNVIRSTWRRIVEGENGVAEIYYDRSSPFVEIRYEDESWDCIPWSDVHLIREEPIKK